MKILRKILKWFLYVVAVPVTYMLIALILTYIPVNRKSDATELNKTIYLNTNGVHLDIIIPIKNLESELLKGIKHHKNTKYLSFGWGEENFYINTPTWGDLTFKNAFKALFLKSSTLMHITRYQKKRKDWVEIKINTSELQKLNFYINNTFQTNEDRMKIILENKGYTYRDDFYRAKGSYSCFKTCNSWVNTAFKESGLKACLWTPFDFGLIHKYN